jgi:hypothetical protein
MIRPPGSSRGFRGGCSGTSEKGGEEDGGMERRSEGRKRLEGSQN